MSYQLSAFLNTYMNKGTFSKFWQLAVGLGQGSKLIAQSSLLATFQNTIGSAILFAALGLPIQASGQVSPGGVSEPAAWIKTIENDASYELREMVGKSKLTSTDQKTKLNFNPAIHLDGTTSMEIKIKPKTNVLNIFPIYKSNTSDHEHFVWSTYSNNKMDLVQTNKRIADIRRHGVINLLDAKEGKIQLHVYQNIGTSKTATTLNLNKNNNVDLPVENFNGLFPELVLYDRILSQEERLKVETYLSLKYGVSLRQQPGLHSYIGSQGSLLFNNESTFLHRIAGLAVDPASDLCQLKSRAEDEDLFYIESVDSNQQKLTKYLLWGDDDGPKHFDKTSVKNVYELGRKWKIQSTNWGGKIRLSVDISSLKLNGEEALFLKLNTRNGTKVIENENSSSLSTSFVFDIAGAEGFTFLKGKTERTFNYVSISPNPSSGLFQIEYEKANTQPTLLKIWDESGRMIRSSNLGSTSYLLRQEQINHPGIYFIELKVGAHSHTQKIIIL